MKPGSLRARIVIGGILWTLGLFAVAMLIVRSADPSKPWPVVFHGLFSHPGPFVMLALVFMAGGFWRVKTGLSVFNDLRRQLFDVRNGGASRVKGTYPSEVQPLIEDLNALLDQRELTVRRAVATAGDLAHGLKTPMAVLSREAERAAAAGHAELAASILQQVDRMRRQVERHLVQSRAAVSGAIPGVSCQVRESADALARTLLHLYADRNISIEVAAPAEHAVRCDRESLDEMLGNLLDNACKWARSGVIVASAMAAGRISITVDDDGPGIPEAERPAMVLRGARGDETTPGHGLGLAIVRDLADLHTGTLTLETSAMGGLRARLELPSS